MARGNSSQTPAQLGYFMPPEWYLHESTWLSWPKNRTTWPTAIAAVQEIYLNLICSLAISERVDLLVDSPQEENRVRRRLRKNRFPSHNIRFHNIPTSDCWIRDYGPNFLIRPVEGVDELALNQWNFNAWGGRYPDLESDATIPLEVASRLDLPRFSPQLTLEGGAIDVNGAGACLASEPCLLNPNRNPANNREEIERELRNHLGVKQIIWTGEGIAGDDTDAHVDQIARFVAPGTIVCSREKDPDDPNFYPLQDNWDRLRLARDGSDQPFELIALPMPPPLETPQGRLPASYANFYIANGLVLFPTFGVPQDSRVEEILKGLFPRRRVIGLDCREVLLGKGALHCMTQQQPARRQGSSTAIIGGTIRE